MTSLSYALDLIHRHSQDWQQQVLILRGGSEEAYLSQLKHVEELGLFL